MLLKNRVRFFELAEAHHPLQKDGQVSLFMGVPSSTLIDTIAVFGERGHGQFELNDILLPEEVRAVYRTVINERNILAHDRKAYDLDPQKLANTLNLPVHTRIGNRPKTYEPAQASV